MENTLIIHTAGGRGDGAAGFSGRLAGRAAAPFV